MKVARRVLLLFLAVLLSTSGWIGIISAKDIVEPVKIQVFNGKTTDYYEVIVKDKDFYFSAKAFEQLSNYTLAENEQKLYFIMGKKGIAIDKNSGDMHISVLNYKGTIPKPIIVNGEYYLSASSLLPWLNVRCGVDNGVFEIITDGISLWQITGKFDYFDYMFNIYEEYGDSLQSIAGLSAMTTFDTIINLRWDRLVPAEGLTGTFQNKSLYDYECYISALTEIAQTQPFVGEEAEKRIESIIKVNDGLNILEEVIGTDKLPEELIEKWNSISGELESYHKILKYMDVVSVLKTYELITAADVEYKNHLIWLSEHGTDNTLFDKAIRRTNKILDEEWGTIITGYSEFGKAILNEVPNEVIKAIGNNTLNDAVINACNAYNTSIFSSLNSYMLVAKIIFSEILPIAEGYEGMAKVSINETMQDYCWNLAGDLQEQEMSIENIKRIRQSYLMALQLSKMSYEAMQKTMDVKLLGEIVLLDGEGLLDYKLNAIDSKIDCLVASIDATENDSIDGKDEYKEEIKKDIRDVKVYTDIEEVSEDIYFDFLAQHPEYNYYSFLDVNDDGSTEMLAAKELYDNGDVLASYYAQIDLFAYKGGNIKRVAEDIWSKFCELTYNEDSKCIVASIDGPDGPGYELTYLNQSNEAVSLVIERGLDGTDEEGYELGQVYVDFEEVSPEDEEKYIQLWETIQEGKCSEIDFEFFPTDKVISSGGKIADQVKTTKEIYKEIENNLDSYVIEDGGGDTTRYVENGKIRKIVTGPNTYEGLYNENIDGYTAEYYYKDDEVVYVIVHSEYDVYRFYLERGNYTNCLRYIDEYGTVYDYPEGMATYEVNELGEFCSLAMQELHWAGVF